MKDYKKLLISPNVSLREALGVIDMGACKIALVVDDGNQLLGTLTDGDARRAMLSGVGLEESITTIFNDQPVTCRIGCSRDELARISKINHLYQIPLVDQNHCVVGLAGEEDYFGAPSRDNMIVIMAGGLGERMRPLTDNIPKPMLTVGGKPILEIIIDGFIKSGFSNFLISVNYKSEVIKEYFGNGSKKGIFIKYIDENKKLGTAGAISLMGDYIKSPFFIINGDILTNIDYEKMLDNHVISNSEVTIALKEYSVKVPYGVVNFNKGEITSIVEKPEQNFFINGGIYVASEEIILEIPKDEYFDMPSLLNKIMKKKKRIGAYPIKDYWLDIGRPADYHKANAEYEYNF